jgi:hypothetical protein
MNRSNLRELQYGLSGTLCFTHVFSLHSSIAIVSGLRVWTRKGVLTLGAESIHFQRFFDLVEAPQGLAIMIGTLVINTKWLASTWSRLVHATLLICISARV